MLGISAIRPVQMAAASACGRPAPRTVQRPGRTPAPPVTGSDIKIYWLNGSKVADNYGDLYDGSWDDETNTKNETRQRQQSHPGDPAPGPEA